MELKEITEAIKQWDTSRKDVSLTKKLFSLGNCFTFELSDAVLLEEEFIHAYLSVVKEGTSDVLNMLLIASSKDHKEQADIHKHVAKIPVISEAIPKDIVDPEEAKMRIRNWENHCEDWLESRSNQNKELHQVFVIPKKYLKNNRTYIAFFALKDGVVTPNTINSLVGDMIVWDKVSSTIIYPNSDDTSDTFYNTVRLVPPFGQKNKENFFLLKLAGIKN
ncbi:hypothetical protein [uncultured Dokdonia sp.]|uniref:hypothetical protein n=1 Tax=uncultured Dokdonia sp. TaxID=575653 RepID=UPI00263670B0|nr:hypothetical protein [uncultured Dokdonia sp.]